MHNHTRLAMGLSILAIVSGACSPALTTPPVALSSPAVPTLPAAATDIPASTQPGAAPDFKSPDPSTLTYLPGIYGVPITLDPAADYETSGGAVIQNTYDTLIFYNKDDPNSFVPQLATTVPSQASGGVSADGKAYTFNIRTGIKFHNGDTLTPDDVAFTFQRGLLQGGSGSAQWLLFQPILGLDASVSGNFDITDLVDASGQLLDDRANLLKIDPAKLLAACQTVVGAIVADDAANTVTFHLAQPWGPFLATIANTWGSISDKQWIGANGGWDGDCHSWQNFYGPTTDDLTKLKIGSSENGTGPYVLASSTTQQVVLKAFDSYWRTSPAWPGGPAGAPRLKTIVIKSVVQAVARLAALQAGDADFIEPGSSSDFGPWQAVAGQVCGSSGDCQPGQQANSPLRVIKGLPNVSRDDIFFNFKIDAAGGNDFTGSGQLDGNGIPPDFFDDVHVRKAFNYCFDWDGYARQVFQGEATQSIDVMLPGEIGYSDQDPHYSYDPARCKAEFLAATIKSASGHSLWDTGFKVTMTYNTGNTFRQAAAQILSQDVSAVNPKFIVKSAGLPWPTFLAAQTAHKLPFFINGWLEDIHDPHDWLVPYSTGVIASRQSLPADLQQTLGDLVKQGVSETDPARRAAIYQQFNQAYYDAAPAILLNIVLNRVYQARWVQGYFSNPIYDSFYYYALSKQ